MSVSSILDPSTGKIASQFLSPAPAPPPTSSFPTLTMTPPGTISFQKTNPTQAEVLSLLPSAETGSPQRLTFTTNASPPTADTIQTGPLRLLAEGTQSNAPAVVLTADGTDFTLTTSSGATPILVSGDVLELQGLTTINAGVYPPLDSGGGANLRPQFPAAGCFQFTLPVPTGDVVGKKLVATISVSFTLAPALAFPAGTGNDPSIQLVFYHQSGTHTPPDPLPAPTRFSSASPNLLYPALFDGSNVAEFNYTITATDTFVSDGATTWSFQIDAVSPTHTYALSSALATATLLASSS